MQVVAGGGTGGAHVADDVAGEHVIPRPVAGEVAHVAVEGDHAVAVVDHDAVTVAAVVFAEDDAAVRRGKDGRAAVSRDVDAESTALADRNDTIADRGNAKVIDTEAAVYEEVDTSTGEVKAGEPQGQPAEPESGEEAGPGY